MKSTARCRNMDSYIDVFQNCDAFFMSVVSNALVVVVIVVVVVVVVVVSSSR